MEDNKVHFCYTKVTETDIPTSEGCTPRMEAALQVARDILKLRQEAAAATQELKDAGLYRED